MRRGNVFGFGKWFLYGRAPFGRRGVKVGDEVVHGGLALLGRHALDVPAAVAARDLVLLVERRLHVLS